jgi:nucleoside permease NupC
MEEQLNNLSVLLYMNSELNIINGRLIDVLMLPTQEKNKYTEQIKELQEQKKKLQKMIGDYIKK